MGAAMPPKGSLFRAMVGLLTGGLVDGDEGEREGRVMVVMAELLEE